MAGGFNKVTDKVESFAEKQRKEFEEKKAKLSVSGRNALGLQPGKKSKSRAKSKVEKGMQVLCVLIAIAVALIIVNINVWPFNLFNGAGGGSKFTSRILPFIITGIPVYIISVLIAKPSIKRLEKKYGKQAW